MTVVLGIKFGDDHVMCVEDRYGTHAWDDAGFALVLVSRHGGNGPPQCFPVVEYVGPSTIGWTTSVVSVCVGIVECLCDGEEIWDLIGDLIRFGVVRLIDPDDVFPASE